jgi:hypothetical protein
VKNSIRLLMMVSFLSLAYAGPTRTWDNGDNNGLWTDAKNWSSDIAPTISNSVDIVYLASGQPTIWNGDVANAFQIRVFGSGGNIGALNIQSGGTLNVGEWLMVSYNAVGYDGVVNTSGTINLGQSHSSGGHLWVGFNSEGTLNVNDGVINVTGVFGISEYSDVSGTVNLYGGTIYANSFRMNNLGGTAGRLDIRGSGKLIIEGDVDDTISTYIANNWITASSGGAVQHDYGITTPGATTIWVLEPAMIFIFGFGALGLVTFRNKGVTY